MTVARALELKGLEYERVDLTPGPTHKEEMARIYGEGKTTVPGLLIDDEPVHGSRPILARLEELAPEPALFPEPIADAVREAERWGDEELQDLGRRLPWGALYFRPEAMGTYVGGEPLDPAGTDYVIRTHPDLVGVPPDHRRAPRRGPRRPAGEARPRRRAGGRRDRRRRASRPRPTCRSAPPCASCSPSATCGR